MLKKKSNIEQTNKKLIDLSNIGPWFHFGRLRPLHTNAVIFAFGGCGLIGIYLEGHELGAKC